VFSDSLLRKPRNGGFKDQEDFHKYVMEHHNGKWESGLTAIPTSDRNHDHKDDTLGDAFPFQFPYGHTGLSGDPAVTELKKKFIKK
jgi:hypothetical protein